MADNDHLVTAWDLDVRSFVRTLLTRVAPGQAQFAWTPSAVREAMAMANLVQKGRRERAAEALKEAIEGGQYLSSLLTRPPDPLPKLLPIGTKLCGKIAVSTTVAILMTDHPDGPGYAASWSGRPGFYFAREIDWASVPRDEKP